MTVANEVSSISYSGDGSSVTFAVPFYFLEDEHLLVIERSSAGVETTKVLDTDYSVTGAGEQSGGSIEILTTAPASGTTLHII